MKTNWPTKKLGRVLIGIVFTIFGVAFFTKEQYWQSFSSIGLLIILLKIDFLKKIIFGKNYVIEAEFEIPEEKIKQDIKENKKPFNKKNLISFRDIEEKVLQKVQKKTGGVMKRQIHFVYGQPPNLEFSYTPDAVIQTEDELIFIEIKYISKPEFTNRILSGAINQLKYVLEKFSPSAGKKLIMKLIVASKYNIQLQNYPIPKGIDLEYYRL